MRNQTKSKKNAYTVLMPKNLLTKEENDKLLQDFVELLKPSADCPFNFAFLKENAKENAEEISPFINVL